MKKNMMVGLAIFAFAIAMVGSALIPVAYAIHNGVGHSDKLSLGECYRATGGDKDGCQAGKDDWKEAREDSRGPPNGGAADGDPANDVAGPANPDFD